MSHVLFIFNRIGETKVRMSSNYFGGDPRRFIYSIRLMTDHLYDTFYQKISGDSMIMWMTYIDSFRLAIWMKMGQKCTIEETYDRTHTLNHLTSMSF